MRICIVGAGWYGCHLGLSLLQKGYEIQIFEKRGSTISGASRYNQNRLHQGFHYPRDFETRKQSLSGFSWFVEHYGNLVRTIDNNLYAVANKSSYLDYETFKQVMTASGLNFDESVDESLVKKFQNINGIMNTSEGLILNKNATKYFDDILSKHITFNTEIDLSDVNRLKKLKNEYDAIIDCTWGVARKIPDLDYYYEPCIYFYYVRKNNEDFAFTLMDGQFFSIYPYDYEEKIYTVTSVRNTPITQVKTKEDVGRVFAKYTRDEDFIEEKRKLFEEEIEHFYPEFLNEFEYVEPVFSLKTKLVSGTDFRGCIVKKEDNLISVFSGKIDTLHIAESAVLSILEEL
ncbi:FAD-dependent oxidoreductase [Vibrio breoganii]